MAKTDRNKGHYENEHFTIMSRSLMCSAAFKALSCTAKALYPFLRLEWKGPKYNNNGRIKYSYRQAADALGISKNTAMRAFHDLQAKGFIRVTELGALGVEGSARGPSYELTEIKLPNSSSHGGSNLYMKWQPGKGFDIISHSTKRSQN